MDVPPDDPRPAPVEIAGAAYFGTLTPLGAEARDPPQAFGAVVRVRPVSAWAAELAVGWEGQRLDPRLSGVHLFGDPYAAMVPFVAAGVGWSDGPLVEGGFGVDTTLWPALDLRGELRLRAVGSGEVAFVWTLALQAHRPHQYDGDRDGIADDDDSCRTTPEDRDGYADTDGCPDPDNDGDGVQDLGDACPEQREDTDGFLDGDGCPDPDNDGDGLPDPLDICPAEPEDPDGFADRDGCFDADNDGDHLYDGVDACPNVAEDEDAFEDTDGCPEPDNDGDGVGDRFDGAPDAAETRNGWEDADGVPDALPPILARVLGAQPRIVVVDGALTDAALERVDLLASVLLSFPAVRVVVAAPDPEVVRARLEADGVAPDRIETEVADAVTVRLAP